MPNWLLGGAAIFLVAGTVFLLTVNENFHPWGFRTAGVAGVLAAGGMVWIWYSAETKQVQCDPVGFRTRTLSRRKPPRDTVYRWSDVTATDYRVVEFKSKDDPTTYQGKYTVSTAEGDAFSFDDSFREFAEVVAACTAMTTHLPYAWLPRQRGQDWEYAVDPAGHLAGQPRPVHPHAKFVCLARSPATAVPPIPPPLQTTVFASTPPPLPG